MKKNIDLIIDGIAPEKVMYDTDNHSLVVLYPAQEEFKRGDIVIHDNSKRVSIFDEYGTNKKDFKAITSMMDFSNGTYTNVTFNKHWSTYTLRMATDNEAKLLFDLLKKIGKRWNRDTLEIEELDIPEIVVDLGTACEYLKEPMPRNYVCDAYVYDNKTDFEKQINAQIELQMIRKAWNKFDGFVVDFKDGLQAKYYLEMKHYSNGTKVLTEDYYMRYANMDTSCYSFKSKERAKQFGTQFKELLETAMGL